MHAVKTIRIAHLPWADDRARCYDEPGCHSGCLVVVSDPDEECGFHRGAEITRSEAQIMMLARCFTLGTRLHYPGHGELTIVEYTFPVMRGTAVMIRTVQAMKGVSYYLVPDVTVGRCFIRVGIHGQRAER